MKKIYINLFIISLVVYIDIIFINLRINKLEANQINEIVIKNDNSLNRYILGPGDKLRINIYMLERFNTSVQILPDGYIHLARIQPIKLKGLTIEEAKYKIELEYNKILRDPIVLIDLLETRPVKFNIIGELQNPGIYSIDSNETSLIMNASGGLSKQVSSKGWPTLIDSIQKAGGITSNANIKKVIIKRKNRYGGEIKEIKINLWDSFYKNNYYNPNIYDQDTIIIEKVKKRNDKDIILLRKLNLSPSEIKVQIIGEVKKEGEYNVKSNTPLMHSLLIAGGLTNKSRKSNINLIRLQDNGSLYRKTFKYEPLKEVSKNYNPLLRDGDIILIGKNNITKITEILERVTTPLNPIIKLNQIQRMVSD